MAVLLMQSAWAADPDSVTGLYHKVYSSTAAELFWQRAVDVDGPVKGYAISRDGQSLGVHDVTSWFADDLEPGIRYRWSVVAVDADGNRSAPVEISFSTDDASQSQSGLIAPPAGLQLRVYSVTALELFWQRAEEPGLRYSISRNGETVGLTDGISFYDEHPAALTAEYQVVAENADGARSVAVSISASDDPDSAGTDQPTSPGGLRLNVYSSTSAELFWNRYPADAGVHSFQIHRDGQVLGRTDGISWYDATREAGAQYRYEVIAYDLLGQASAPALIDERDEQGDGSSGGNSGETFVPSPADPFGLQFETDPNPPRSDGLPSAPNHLRVELISNDWAELNWTPSLDDRGIVGYRIYRSDGHVYTVRADQTDPVGGSQQEIDKYWATTTFIDCNYTRFDLRLHACTLNGPMPGETYHYHVTAVDTDGNESSASNSVTVRYPEMSGAVIDEYQDFYLPSYDDFVHRHDLSATTNFLPSFSLRFADEFDGERIDSTRWQTQLTWGSGFIINDEQQYFVDVLNQPGFGYDPFVFTGNTLKISAIPTPESLKSSLPEACSRTTSGGAPNCAFLSGALSSHDRYGLLYGYVEARMKVSSIPGALSSFYLYHRYPGEGAWRHAPEIDIIEYLGENPYGSEDAFQTYHYLDVHHDTVRSAPTMIHKKPDGGTYADEWHTYGVLWEPQLVIWYIDGQEIRRMSGPQVARQPMNIVTYLVTGSGWAPTPSPDGEFPITLEIDYIRAYQREGLQGQ